MSKKGRPAVAALLSVALASQIAPLAAHANPSQEEAATAAAEASAGEAPAGTGEEGGSAGTAADAMGEPEGTTDPTPLPEGSTASGPAADTPAEDAPADTPADEPQDDAEGSEPSTPAEEPSGDEGGQGATPPAEEPSGDEPPSDPVAPADPDEPEPSPAEDETSPEETPDAGADAAVPPAQNAAPSEPPAAAEDDAEEADAEAETDEAQPEELLSAVALGTESVRATVSSNGSSITLSASGGQFDRAWNVSFEVSGSRGTTWVAATRQADGTWSCTLASSSVGSSTVRATAWANVGSAPAASFGTASAKIPTAQASMSLAFDAASGKLVLSARNVSCPSGVTFVSAGVSGPSGPERWYRLSQQADGTWSASVDPADFGWQAGTYTVAGSICDSAWAGVSVGSSRSSVSYGGEKTSATVSDDGSKLVLTASGGRFDRAWNVSFEVSGSRGTTWVAATRQADGTWKVQVPASKAGSGTVKAAAWGTIGSSAAVHIASSSADVAAAKAQLSLSYDSSSRKLVLSARNVSCPSGVTFVSAGVSGPSGPERWYRLSQQADGTWSASVDPADFGWQAGTYTVAGSICDSAWAGVSVGSSRSSVSYGGTSLSATTDSKGGTVTLTARGDVVAAAGNVAFCIKGDGYGKHTGSTWHQAYRQADGSWTATVKASSIGSGTCSVQTVATVGSTTQYLATKQFSIGGVSGSTAASGPSSTGALTVTVSNLSSATGIKSVSIGAFNGSTSRWYTCSKNSSGAWVATIPVSDFGYAGGTYTFEATVTDSFGNNLPLPKITKSVPLASGKVEAEVDGPNGTLWLAASGGAATYAWGVSFAVTDAGGTTDWIAATKNENGAWVATTPASTLAYGSGTVKAYVNVGSSTVVLGSDYFSRVMPANATMQQRIQNYSSPTGYLLAIDTSGCRVGVYTGSRGHWEQVAYWLCSPGAYSTPTVTGVFSVGSKGYYFDSYGSRCFYYTQFYGDYLFHSTLYYPSGGVMDDRLGMNLSHGCVRLATSNAKWIYDNIPTGTTVVSY